MRKNTNIVNEMYALENSNGTYKAKCLRNLRAYEYSPTLSLNNLDDNEVVGYFASGSIDMETDTTSIVQENIIKSCVDTLVSKIASQKVRPFINTVNGSFKDMQVVKTTQNFFDNYFDEEKVGHIMTTAFRDACIFDRGFVYVNNFTKKIERVLPWQISIDPKENTYNRLTKICWTQKHYPVSLLSDSIKVPASTKEVTFIRYWKNNKYYEYIPEIDYYSEITRDTDVLPFIILHYCTPIKCNSSTSVVDMLYGIQKEVDCIIEKIKDASQLACPLKYFVPQQSDIKVQKLSNRVGEVITYNLPPNYSGSPITVATDPFMDPQWLATLTQLKQDAYELVGISQLSATSQKPKGLDSGVALSTMEDIESDRFETQLNQVIQSYVDLAKICIEVFDGEVMPPDRYRTNVKWEEIQALRKRMSIQFSAAENLSKDPSTKLQQLQALVAAGVIPQSRVAQLMELPDLQQGYSFANNAINAVMEIIDECIENGNMDIPLYIPTDMLQEEIINTCLSLKAAGRQNDGDIAKLMELYKVAEKMKIDSTTSAEMAALNKFQTDIQNDLQNPNGQINTMVNQATQTATNMMSGNVDNSAFMQMAENGQNQQGQEYYQV